MSTLSNKLVVNLAPENPLPRVLESSNPRSINPSNPFGKTNYADTRASTENRRSEEKALPRLSSTPQSLDHGPLEEICRAKQAERTNLDRGNKSNEAEALRFRFTNGAAGGGKATAWGPREAEAEAEQQTEQDVEATPERPLPEVGDLGQPHTVARLLRGGPLEVGGSWSQARGSVLNSGARYSRPCSPPLVLPHCGCAREPPMAQATGGGVSVICSRLAMAIRWRWRWRCRAGSRVDRCRGPRAADAAEREKQRTGSVVEGGRERAQTSKIHWHGGGRARDEDRTGKRRSRRCAGDRQRGGKGREGGREGVSEWRL
ncbi:hypothetical protein MPTK1_2g08390 [Marchantia polymorpha subsp. ruderalis]|uniref:Uncharacterized protein n=1 Tax=Marchantia polymorpha TaxID=3197 RepID=A0A2R6XGU3_MARPO|nr:hypothetical protein MARPO_0015s0124 [Marchantia polymorpha]BBN01560.1 hypothetical protein Mp_2g08390 [Marchantia polymorpha subsp. ruderalis]|eukprot:PTQ45326.1 hypothetical protein MARPO_0015s0124 [Marchantia polymorpha]